MVRLLLILSLILASHSVVAGTGLNLIIDCEHAKNMWTDKPANIEKGCNCSSLIKGITAVMIITANSSDKKTAYNLGICNPSNEGHFIPVDQAVFVVYKYLEENPQKLQEQDFSLVMQALQQSFKCPVP